MSSSRVDVSLSGTATLKTRTSLLVATYNLEALNANPEMVVLEFALEHKVFCLIPLSRRKSPRIRIKYPLSNPAAIKFKFSSITRDVKDPEL